MLPPPVVGVDLIDPTHPDGLTPQHMFLWQQGRTCIDSRFDTAGIGQHKLRDDGVDDVGAASRKAGKRSTTRLKSYRRDRRYLTNGSPQSTCCDSSDLTKACCGHCEPKRQHMLTHRTSGGHLSTPAHVRLDKCLLAKAGCPGDRPKSAIKALLAGPQPALPRCVRS